MAESARTLDATSIGDTPRTDAAMEARSKQRAAFPDPVVVECMKLEREVNELRHDLERAMRNHNADLNP